MSRRSAEPEPGPDRSDTSDPPVGSDVGSDSEAITAWTSGDAEAVAAENRSRSIRRDRLRSDVRSLASQAVAISGS